MDVRTVLGVCLLIAAPALAADRAAIIPSPPLAPGADALPRLDGAGPAVARINGSLAAIDAAAADLLDCEEYGRSVEVLFDGPGYVAFADSSGYYCPGAAHPWWGTAYLTFDLVTGDGVGPDDLLPPGTTDGALWSLFLAHLDPTIDDECRGVLQDYADRPLGGMVLWPSAEGPALGMAPRLAWVDAYCVTEIHVPVDDLARLGFPERLLNALRQSGE